MPRKRDRRRRGEPKPRLHEAWERLAGEMGGEVELTGRGKPDLARLPHGPWTVVLDIHTVSTGNSTARYNRVRALFERDGAFMLKVTRRHAFHALAPLFGLGGVHIRYGRVDRELFVRSDRPEIARSALRATSLGQALLGAKGVSLQVIPPGKAIRKVTGDSVGEVQLLAPGIERDPTRLRHLVEIVTMTLDELARLGVATTAEVAGVAI